jgi:hypothetical protein
VYAEPELDIKEDISETDKLESKATKPARMKAKITDGPANFAAACPLKTNMPAPAIQFIRSSSREINAVDVSYR